MRSLHLHPYRTSEEVHQVMDRLHEEVSPIVHPQQMIQKMRSERPPVSRLNGWPADHIVGLAGTMMFFYLLCLVLAGWVFWQSVIGHDNGFDPFPYAFLFFVLGGIMQSLFVPTMLTASNRTAGRDRIKDEADHRAWSHLYQPVSGSLLGQRLQRVALSVIWPEPISWLQRSCPHHDTAKEGVT